MSQHSRALGSPTMLLTYAASVLFSSQQRVSEILVRCHTRYDSVLYLGTQYEHCTLHQLITDQRVTHTRTSNILSLLKIPFSVQRFRYREHNRLNRLVTLVHAY